MPSCSPCIAVDCSVFSYSHGGLASFFRPFLQRLLAEFHACRFILVAPERISLDFLQSMHNWSRASYDDTNPLVCGRGASFRPPVALSHALHKVKADYLVSPYYAFLIPPRYRNRSMIFLHDTCFWDIPECFSKKDILLHKGFMAWNKNMAKYVGTVSATSKNRILKNFPGLPAEKIKIIHNTWADNTPRGAHSGERLSFLLQHAPQYLFLNSGGYSRSKNVNIILYALKKIVDAGADAGLVVTGTARYSAEFWKIIDDLDLYKHVIPVGVIADSEMEWLLRERVSASVCMSLYEGFGRSLVEAMRVGLPLISSDIPTSREIAGAYPFAYCEGNDVEGLATAMQQVMSVARNKPMLDNRFRIETNWEILKNALMDMMYCNKQAKE